MPSLGQMLLADKVITKAQLEETIRNQVIFGGRFGTNLIELGYLDEQTLTKYLSRKHSVPTVDWGLLNRIKPEVLKVFTKKLAKKTEAFPLKVEGRDLYVVMADPANFEKIQEIEFATRKHVKPLVLPEIRVYDLLMNFYGIGRELRYINLAMNYKQRDEEVKPAQPEFKAAAAAGMNEKEWREREALRQKMTAEPSGELLSQDDFQRIADQEFAQIGKGAEPAAELPPIDVGPIDTAPPVAPVRPAPPVPRPPEPPPAEPAPATVEPLPPPMAPAAARRVEPKTAPPPAPRPSGPPFRETAQALYKILIKAGVHNHVPKATLQEFLKIFVKRELKNNLLSLTYLANWLIIEGNVPVEMIEAALEEAKKTGLALGLTMLLPGEKAPEKPAVVAQAPVAEPAAPEPTPVEPAALETLEVVETGEEIPSGEPVEELPLAALTPVETPEPEPAPTPAPPPAAVVEPLPADAILEPAPPPAPGAAQPEVMVLEAADLAEAEVEYQPEEEPEPVEEEPAFVQLSLPEAQKKLNEANDRRDISRIIIGFAMGYFKRSLLFTVRGTTLFGWDGHGPGINADSVESVMLPLSDPSVFKLVNDLKSFFLGPIPPGPINDRFLKTLGNERPNNIFIMPVVTNEKVVYMLYGDNGAGQFVPPNAPELQILAYQIPRALDTLIRRKKAEKPAA